MLWLRFCFIIACRNGDNTLQQCAVTGRAGVGFIPSSGTGGAVQQEEGTGAQSCARAVRSPVSVHQLSINTELSGCRNPADCECSLTAFRKEFHPALLQHPNCRDSIYRLLEQHSFHGTEWSTGFTSGTLNIHKTQPLGCACAM